MKISKRGLVFLFLTGCLLLGGLVLPVEGQSPAVGNAGQEPRSHDILGTLDPQTGTFKPLVKPGVIEDSEASPEVIAPTTGTFKVNFTISVKSTIPSGDAIACAVNAETIEETTGNIILESAQVAAVRGGSTATCAVDIPYSWLLKTPTTDSTTISYTITTPVGSSANTTPLPGRSSTHSIATIKVPSSGSTTTYSLTPTI